MIININATSTTTGILTCMPIQDIQEATENDTHIKQFTEYIINGWLSNRNEVTQVI